MVAILIDYFDTIINTKIHQFNIRYKKIKAHHWTVSQAMTHSGCRC